jgi:hypothetical protein
MSRPTIRRLANLEKQATTVLAATQYPPIPPLSECKGWTLQRHIDLWERVRRGEYSETPEEEVQGRRTWDLKGKTPEELADIYGQMCQETEEEVRRELATWTSADFPPKPSSPR